jgi:hypothetical protein
MALWPTSELPMSSSDGMPTAVPWARRRDVRVIGEQAVQRRLARGGDGAADIGLGNAVAVHDDDDDRAPSFPACRLT